MQSNAKFGEPVKKLEESAFFVLKETGVERTGRKEHEAGLRDLRKEWLTRVNQQLKGAA